MNCDRIEVWISAYQDGELDPRRRQIVEAHLAECAACRALTQELDALAGTLRAGLTHWPAPETLHTRVMREIPDPDLQRAPALGGSRVPRGWFSFGLVPIGAAAAWMLLAGQPRITTTDTPSKQSSVVASTDNPTALPTDNEVSPADPVVKPEATQVGLVKPPPSGGEKKPGDASEKVKPEAGTGTPKSAGASPGVRPKRSRGYRPELESLRRLERLRRQPQYRLAKNGHRRRSPRRDQVARAAPAPERTLSNRRPAADSSKQTLASRMTVVDYVLPEVRPDTSAAGEQTGFVIRPAEPYQVSQAGFEY